MTDKELIESLPDDAKIVKSPAPDMNVKSVFETLYAANVNEHTEKVKSGDTELTYLSWAYAIAEVKKRYPDMQYEIEKFNGLPYVFDELTGYMVYTKVTIQGITHEMWLPVMDSANKAMKATPYTYKVRNKNFKYATKNKEDGKYYDKYGNEQTEFIEKTVEAATMFDINKTIMRCLTKNLAMHGLGLYIYAGEDLPEQNKEDSNKILLDELKTLWDQAGGNDGFEEWIKKNTEVKGLEVMYPELKTALKKKIADKAEGEKK